MGYESRFYIVNKSLPVVATNATARVWRVEDVHKFLHSWILLIKNFSYLCYVPDSPPRSPP